MTGLAERQAVDAAIAELAAITDPAQIAERAESIARHGNVALAALIAALDTDDPQLRGGLGQVALRLPRAQVVAALRATAGSRKRSLQARLTALTLLERYFHEPPDEVLLSGLESPEAVALRSLAELAKAMEQEPLAILEYLAQLEEQPPDVPHLLLQAVPAAPVTGALITLLRMFAQGTDVKLAQGALEHLGRIRSAAAARALAALAKTLPPSLASLAERGARKLALSGVNIAVEDDVSDRPWFVPGRKWRVLVSPLDGTGGQLLWFIGHVPGEEHALLISVLIEEGRGLTTASGALDMAVADLPVEQPAGTVHRVAVSQQPVVLLLLEVPLGVGQELLSEALAWNWAGEMPTPLAYRLLNLPLWLAAPAQTESPAAAVDNAVDRDSVADPTATAALLEHPAFWGWWGLVAQEAGSLAVRKQDRPAAVTQFVQRRFTGELVAAYSSRLERMARWLTLAGEFETAALARLAADQLRSGPPEEAPFLRRMVELGFEAAELLQAQRNKSSNQGV
ncbi:MAG: hypothetical protein ACUVR4_00155 [Anaerolineae bacterium]